MKYIHHLSHYFEITGIIDNTDYFPHGIDVAYSTVITAEIREKIVNYKFPNKVFRLEKNDYRNKMHEIYKSVADGCIKLQDKIRNYQLDRSYIYLQKEQEIKEILADAPSAQEIKNMLLAVGLDIKEFYDLYDAQKIKNAILYAKDLKDRYTVLWLNYDFFADR